MPWYGWLIVALIAPSIVLLGLTRLLRFLAPGPCPYQLAWLLDHPLRREQTRRILDRMGLEPGMRVLELGPGPGALTLDAAERIGPQGRLHCLDVQPQMVARVRERTRRGGVSNVSPCVADGQALPLRDGCFDLAFLVSVLPEIPDQHRALAELRRVLRPGGTLSITEQFPDPDYPLARTTIRRVEKAGFELAERHGNWWCYTVNFQEPVTAAASPGQWPPAGDDEYGQSPG